MKQILQLILQILAQVCIWRYHPFIVAVTGNVGKTSTKEAIAAVLKKSGKKVRVSGGNLNNEWGVPLTVLGDWSDRYYKEGSIFKFWPEIVTKALAGLIFKVPYPEVLVLEYGAGKPGDIKKLAKDFKPNIAVVTAVGEIPVHVEYFSGPESLAREKSKLVEVLDINDFAVLNFDDDVVLDMRDKTKAKVRTFGFDKNADVSISNFDFKLSETGGPLGVVFKLNYDNSFVPVKIEGSLGKSQAYSAAAAAAVGLAVGMNLVDISNALASYKGPAGRLKILKGIKNSIIIDDSYNASPASAHLAIDTIKSIPAKRKILVLGDMLELGKYTIEAHRSIGNLAGSFADILVCVGAKAKFIADAAANQMPKDKIFIFDTADEAKVKIQEMILNGDLILVKGSQGMRMEKIVEEIMAEPEKKSELLVRQSKTWLLKN